MHEAALSFLGTPAPEPESMSDRWATRTEYFAPEEPSGQSADTTPPAMAHPSLYQQAETGRVDVSKLDQQQVLAQNRPAAPSAPAAPAPANAPATTRALARQIVQIDTSRPWQPWLHVTQSGRLKATESLIGMQHSLQVVGNSDPQRSEPLNRAQLKQTENNSQTGFWQSLMQKLGLG
jgi:hypothetical protein